MDYQGGLSDAKSSGLRQEELSFWNDKLNKSINSIRAK